MAYKIQIIGFRSGGGDNGSNSVVAYLPENFNLSIEHRWENPFEVDMSKEIMTGLQWAGKGFEALGFGGGFTGAFDPSAVGNLIGIDTMTYMGTSPMTLTFDLEFVVESSIQRELVEPVKTLIKMSCPAGATLSTLGTVGRPDYVTISIPGLLYLPKCYITAVGSEFGKPLVTDGNRTVPMKFTVPMTIVTAEIPTRDRIEEQLFPN